MNDSDVTVNQDVYHEQLEPESKAIYLEMIKDKDAWQRSYIEEESDGAVIVNVSTTPNQPKMSPLVQKQNSPDLSRLLNALQKEKESSHKFSSLLRGCLSCRKTVGEIPRSL